MRQPRNTDPKPRMVLAFLVGAALLLQGLLVGGAALVREFGFGLADKWENQRDKAVQVDLEKEDQAPLPRPIPRPQVVEIERPKVEKVPKKAKFLSEFNSSVKKETQAKFKGLRPVVVASLNRTPPSEAVEPRPKPRSVPEPGVDLNAKPKPSPLSMRRPAPRSAPGARSRADSPWKRKLSLKNLTPSNGSLQKVLPAAFPDYLKDIDFGNRTLLNSKEWKFASFFNRVKRAVAQHWHPDREYSRRDPKGNVYGFKNRLTVLHILLRPDGSLKRIVLERPCGLKFLDDEAIRAFRKAAPFPNPPHRLVNQTTRQIAFRFGFIFEVTRTPSWRIFRLK